MCFIILLLSWDVMLAFLMATNMPHPMIHFMLKKKKHALFMLGFHIEEKTGSTCCHLWCLLCSVFLSADFLHLSSTHSYVPFLKLCSIIAFGWLSVMTFCSTEHKSEREADDSCLCSFLYPALMCPVCWSPKPVVGRALLSPAASL